MLEYKKYWGLKSTTLSLVFAAMCLTLVGSNLSVYGSSNNNDENHEMPYCDQVDSGYQGTCFDSKDIDVVTGLAPCKDGSQVPDYRDCPDRR